MAVPVPLSRRTSSARVPELDVRRMIASIQLILFGTFMCLIGFAFLFGALRACRSQSIRWGVASAVWGLWCLMFGAFKIFEGFGHPLLSDDVRLILFAVFGMVGLVCLLVADYGHRHNQSA